MSAAPDVFGGFRAITDEVKQARISVLAGQPIELDDIVVRLEALLSAARTMPQPVRESIVPTIVNLHDACDQLEALMRAAVTGASSPDIQP